MMNSSAPLALIFPMNTPLLDIHRAAGAKVGEYFRCTLPASFAGFDGEYRAARQSAALFDTSWHAVIALTGPDRARYLNAILSNNILSLADVHGALALLSNLPGHIL